MNMERNFTINCVVDIPKAERTARVVTVANAADEDITRRFIRFCEEKDLPLTSEFEIKHASYEYGRTV